jgi:hypothetical protein
LKRTIRGWDLAFALFDLAAQRRADPEIMGRHAERLRLSQRARSLTRRQIVAGAVSGCSRGDQCIHGANGANRAGRQILVAMVFDVATAGRCIPEMIVSIASITKLMTAVSFECGLPLDSLST